MESYYIDAAILMKNLLHIIRWPNLLMLAGIQTLVFYRLTDYVNSVLKTSDLILLELITILLAAGGYVINDYYDRDIDRINKPDKWIAGNAWTISRVRTFYLVICMTGFLLSIVLALRIGLASYLFIYPLAITGLWLYSYALKCKPVIGNLWVSIFCAGVVGIVGLPDIIFGNDLVIKLDLWYYMAFAFLATWYREMIKDLEDIKGDSEHGCNTFVVRFGEKPGKVISISLGLLLFSSLFLWESKQAGSFVSTGLIALQGFTVASMAFVWWAKDNKYYHQASNVVKIVMAGGTLLLLL